MLFRSLRDALSHYANLYEQPSPRLLTLQQEVEDAIASQRGSSLPKVFF